MSPPLSKDIRVDIKTKHFPFSLLHNGRSGDKGKSQHPIEVDADDVDDDIPLSLLYERPSKKRKTEKQDYHCGNYASFPKLPKQPNKFLNQTSAKIVNRCGNRARSNSSARNERVDNRAVQLPSHLSTEKLKHPPSSNHTQMRDDKAVASVSLSSNSQFCAVNSSPRHHLRIYSDSAMDFVQTAHSSDDRNVVFRILQRETNGCLFAKTNKRGVTSNGSTSFHTITSRTCPNWAWSPQWRIPSWVSLARPYQLSSTDKAKFIYQLAWDEMGVLLALACEAVISIYDWDMVSAADIQGRRDRLRKLDES